ncbi:putative lipoprotein [Helicobacter pylori NQ4099]|uniref:Putative lipoprotein n=1 Tax=Helicobacter pylori NQ4099 TaxID=992026 RepID=I9Q0X5_HELPX|nr:putative lipoprotein [Helicobacter pylori NQ4099]
MIRANRGHALLSCLILALFLLNIGCKSVKSVFKIQLKAFKDNAKNQKNHKIFPK